MTRQDLLAGGRHRGVEAVLMLDRPSGFQFQRRRVRPDVHLRCAGSIDLVMMIVAAGLVGAALRRKNMRFGAK